MFKRHPVFAGVNRDKPVVRDKCAYQNSDRTLMSDVRKAAVHYILHGLGRDCGPSVLFPRQKDLSCHDPRQLAYAPPAGLIAYQMLGARVIR